MRRYVLLAIALIWVLGCSSEDAPDCLKSVGAMVQREVSLPAFSKVLVEDDLQLVLRQGQQQLVVLESGSNIIGDIQARVDGETLRLTNNSSCNLFREYGQGTVYVTSPNLTEIRNSSSFDIRGQGRLRYERLRLVSNTTRGPDFPQKGGDFYLQLECDELSISANGQSVFYLSGTARLARLNFTDEFPRLEAAQLLIEELNILQRSAAPMIVHPQLSIVGEIRGTGDVICQNRPPEVRVEEFFTGRLIFVDP